ncbi:GNAT family N-acetyltransferase [Verrucomicrobia bacterium]|jgi:L-amino acid N-acyltransferase YncA|nr:GNAT family N-acetyltransferase [Verrucomicrobiota bacterium]MDG1890028.1 GNAT family N-acetyltransferase [Verrucomicrobiota bacterium]
MTDFFPPLDGIVDSYPKDFSLKEGLDVTVRPLEIGDNRALFQFFQAVPENERLFIKHKVQEQQVIDGWCKHLDYEKNFPLVAMDADGHILASCTLHQNGFGWKRHIGRISVFVHADFRRRGLAQALVQEIMGVARQLGLEKLEAEFVAEQKRALRVFALLGFSDLATFPKYVMDMQGKHHDYLLMGIHLTTDIEYAGVGG